MSAPSLDAPPRAAVPTRLRHLGPARVRYGGLVDTLIDGLQRTDPVADAVVEAYAGAPGEGRAALERALREGIDAVPEAHPALRALFAEVDRVPAWVDPARLELGARVYRRVSFGGVLTLSAYSLLAGYHSAAAVKPLAFTGGLAARAPRRLAETGRYVVETVRPGGLRRDGAGLHVAVRVRVMHAQVRRMLRASGRWDEAAWGAPINQADMAITAMEFSSMVLRGCRALGYVFEPEESEAVMHLFRYAGYLMGVDAALLPLLESEASARRYEALVRETIDGPDEDSRVLARALLDAFVGGARTPLDLVRALLLRPLHDGLAFRLCGDRVARELGLSNPWLRHLVPAVAVPIGGLERVRRRAPALDVWLTELGGRSLDEQIEKALAGAEPTFDARDRTPGARATSALVALVQRGASRSMRTASAEP